MQKSNFTILSVLYFVLLFKLQVGLCDPWVSKGGKYVAFHADYNRTQLTIWELSSGRELCRIQNPNRQPVLDCVIADVTKLAATITEDGLFVWSLPTGELLWSNDKLAQDSYENISSVAFYPDGKHIVTHGAGGQLSVRRSEDGSERVPFAKSGITDSESQAIFIAPQGDRIYAPARSRIGKTVLKCWDGFDGSVLGEFQSEGDGLYDKTQVAVGQEFIAEIGKTSKADLIVWDALKFTELRRIKVKPMRMVHRYPSLYPERNSVFLEGVEYELNTGEVLSRHEWGDGLLDDSIYYSSILSVPGTSLCCWTHASNEQTFFLGRLQAPRSTNYEMTFQAYSGRRDSATLCAGKPRGILNGRPEEVTIFSKENASNAQQLSSERWTKTRLSPDSIQSNPSAVTESLKVLLAPLPPRSRATIDPGNPRLFVLSVGVSDYQLDEYDLKYAAMDAREIAAKLRLNYGNFYGDVQVTVLTDAQVTPDGLRDGLQWLQRSSTANDLVVVFFAGHGIRAKKGLYYFTHLGDEENIQNTCVNWSDIATALAATKAKNILFLTDCCHAGSFSRDRHVTQEKLAESLSAVGQLSILAASSGEESSFESSQLQHGAFTYAILEGLEGKSDVDHNREISLNELSSYVRKRVGELTDGDQTPEMVKTTNTALSASIARAAGNESSPAPAVQSTATPVER